ncbi:MAG: hypothetical protein ACR2GH_12715 [Pseudonocardia sp.]
MGSCGLPVAVLRAQPQQAPIHDLGKGQQRREGRTQITVGSLRAPLSRPSKPRCTAVTIDTACGVVGYIFQFARTYLICTSARGPARVLPSAARCPRCARHRRRSSLLRYDDQPPRTVGPRSHVGLWALLVRPDGFVAWRSAAASPDAAAELEQTLHMILAR